MTASRVLVALWLTASWLDAGQASAQTPPWAGRPVEPTPPFLLAPPAPETEEPADVRAIRDDVAARAARFAELRARLAEHDRFLSEVRAIGDAALDPTTPSLRSRTVDAIASADAELDGGRADHALGAYRDLLDASSAVPDLRQRVVRGIARALARPRRRHEASYRPLRRALALISGITDERIAMEIMLSTAAALTDLANVDADEAAAEVRREMETRWDCSSRFSSLPPPHACDVEARSHERLAPTCSHEISWGVFERQQTFSCDVVAPPADACASWIRDALRAHQRATLRDAHSVEGLDDRQERIAATRPLFETAAHGYRAWLDGCGGPDAYDVTYNLADALFRSGELRRAAVAFEEVRDWGWQRGRFPSAGSYALVASRLGAESRSRVLDEAIAAGTLVLPELAPTPTPSPPPEPVAALLLAREIHLSRFPDDDDTRASFSLADAALLERYGYWDEARTRYAAVIAAAPVGEDASLAAAGIVRMATALGDGAEVARVTALVPSVR